MRPFFILLAGQIGSWFGSELVQFALVWWLTKTTGQAAVLTFATTVAVLPSILVGPFAGTLVDRWNRRLVMMAADGVIAGATLLLALLFASGWVQLWQVYALLLIRALAAVFHQPAILAATPLLVPEKHLMTLIPLLITKHFGGGAFELGWFQSVFAIGSILGGFLLTAWGGFQRRIQTWLVALILGGLALTLVGLMPADALRWAAAAWFMAGVMSALINGASLTIFQTVVPEAMLGRVFALQLAIVTSLSPLGLYVAGQIADRFGASIWFVLAGIGYALAGLIAPLLPALMQIEEKGAPTAS